MSGRETELKHNRLIRSLEQRVKGKYSITMREVDVRDPDTGNLIGEIDLVGIIGDNWDLYEVKVNDSPYKARKQLERLRHYLDDCGNISLYYYSGRRDVLEKID